MYQCMSIYIVTLLSISNLSIFIHQRSAADRRPALYPSYALDISLTAHEIYANKLLSVTLELHSRTILFMIISGSMYLSDTS